jgi:hypothetical protein
MASVTGLNAGFASPGDCPKTPPAGLVKHDAITASHAIARAVLDRSRFSFLVRNMDRPVEPGISVIIFIIIYLPL